MYGYKTNCGQYVLHDGDTPIGPLLDEVAIALDKDSGTLHKHGSPVHVSAWLADAKAKFNKGGFPDMADDLVMMSGRFTLEDLNACLQISGFAGRLYARVMAGTVQSLALEAK